ncbi:hypothetical protein AAAC51_06890 [Priestia megaterium]
MVVYRPKNTLDEVLFPDEEAKPLESKQQVEAAQNYIPELINDPKWEEFASRMPVPSLSKVQERKAISLGYEELAYMKHNMLMRIRDMSIHYGQAFALFPIALSKDVDEAFRESHKKISSMIEDLENLLDGKVNNIEGVQADPRLHQSFEEQRLKVLHHILTHYDRKNFEKNNPPRK